MQNDTDQVMVYPNLQRPDGSTVVLQPGETFDEPSGEPPSTEAPSVADGPADVTPTAEPAATPVPDVFPDEPAPADQPPAN